MMDLDHKDGTCIDGVSAQDIVVDGRRIYVYHDLECGEYIAGLILFRRIGERVYYR